MKQFAYFLGTLTVIMASSCNHTPTPTQAPKTRVKIEAVKSDSSTGGRSYSGTVEESSGSTLSFSAAGTINRIYVGVGDHVAKGQLLASVDASSLRHAYEIAEATVRQAQDAYDRMKQLHDANALPDIKWVEVQNALSQAQNAAAIAKKGLADANLYAPTSGYISEKYADMGMNVAPGVPVVKLVNIDPVKVNISVPENEIPSLSSKAGAQISVGALGSKTFSGKLTEKGVAANQLSRTYDVKFEVKNQSGELLPGMICDVVVEADSAVQVLSLPAEAVLLDADNQNFVWAAVEGKAEKLLVTTSGMTSGSRIIIGSGLAEGDSVIVSGQQKVSEGTQVINISK